MSEYSSKRFVAAQLIAWLVGLVVVAMGLLDVLIGVRFELVSHEVTVIYAILLLLAPVCWFAGGNRHNRIFSFVNEKILSSFEASSRDRSWSVIQAAVIGLTSLGMSVCVSAKFASYEKDLPPAYHDEYSYLLQAHTFLSGRVSHPSHPPAPELFDQMHAVNQGRFASRYFPGTGVWMMPFVAAGKPYWGHWLAGALAALFIYGSGCELGGRGAGLAAGLLTALSPGLALFSNLLLAHQPTLFGLSVFLYFFLRMQRTFHWGAALAAGCGLAFAMLCRPMTAAGVGLPFGLRLFWWLLKGGKAQHDFPFRLKRVATVGLPVLIGLGLLYPYNKAITGDGWTTPYSQFTRTYTPRHVYGFNNVVRAEEKIASGEALTNDAFENYDRWAENLTPALAGENLLSRSVNSLQWSLGLLPLAMATVVFVIHPSLRDSRWWLILAAIVSLHAVHIPYWFVGIMGWHYVFESAPLWILVFSSATGTLFSLWKECNRHWMPLWWSALTGVALLTNWVAPAPPSAVPVDSAVSEVAYARRKHAEFHRKIKDQVGDRRALVLIEHDPADVARDYVYNPSGWDAEILYGRFRREETDVERILKSFPDRACYLYRVKSGEIAPLQQAVR